MGADGAGGCGTGARMLSSCAPVSVCVCGRSVAALTLCYESPVVPRVSSSYHRARLGNGRGAGMPRQ